MEVCFSVITVSTSQGLLLTKTSLSHIPLFLTGMCMRETKTASSQENTLKEKSWQTTRTSISRSKRYEGSIHFGCPSWAWLIFITCYGNRVLYAESSKLGSLPPKY